MKNTRRGKGSQLRREFKRHPTLSGIRVRDGHDSIVRPRMKPKTLDQFRWSRDKRRERTPIDRASEAIVVKYKS